MSDKRRLRRFIRQNNKIRRIVNRCDHIGYLHPGDVDGIQDQGLVVLGLAYMKHTTNQELHLLGLKGWPVLTPEVQRAWSGRK